MDLGTIKKNLAASTKSSSPHHYYSTIQAAADDVRLVWTNCMTYNADGSDFFMLALTLQKKWDEKYSKFMADFQVVGPGGSGGGGPTAALSTSGNEKVTLDDKKAFAKSLFKLTKEDLGKIIVEIDTKSPGALTKNATEDECEINVDKIPAHLLGELRAFVASCSSSTTNNSSSAAAAAAQPPKKKKKQ